jgi:arylsulfatase A-like enzyme
MDRPEHYAASSVIRRTLVFACMVLAGMLSSLAAWAQQQPNILVIMADDIGYWNVSAYNRGMMGYRTPNIDRIANEGALFTDYYGQQSCTAGRAAFVTGQSPMRTGLLKVGLPEAKEGLSDKDPTLAELLKPLGYMTGQFGKNHLGDRNEFLPTVHGFDVFFGNLYHLNAEDEPEHPDYPKNMEFKLRFGPRGVPCSLSLLFPRLRPEQRHTTRPDARVQNWSRFEPSCQHAATAAMGTSSVRQRP